MGGSEAGGVGGGRARAPSRLRDEADVARRVEGRLRRALEVEGRRAQHRLPLQPRRRPRHLRLRVGAVQPERVAVRRRRRAVAQAHAAQLRVGALLDGDGRHEVPVENRSRHGAWFGIIVPKSNSSIIITHVLYVT